MTNTGEVRPVKLEQMSQVTDWLRIINFCSSTFRTRLGVKRALAMAILSGRSTTRSPGWPCQSVTWS